MAKTTPENLSIDMGDEEFAKQTEEYLNETCWLGASVDGSKLEIRQEEAEYPYDRDILNQVEKVIHEVQVLKGLLETHDIRNNPDVIWTDKLHNAIDPFPNT